MPCNPPGQARWPSPSARARQFLHTHPTRRPGLNWTIWAVLVLVVISVAAGSTSKPKNKPTAGTLNASTSTSASVSKPAPSPTTTTPTATPRTSAATTIKPRPSTTTAPVHAGIVVNAAGAILPNAYRTPGATNPDVTQGDINTTICVSGWTSTIRPDSSYTTGLKEQQLASGYSYRGDQSTADYEEDHLISLELGGSPTSARNLWPEPYQARDGARTKDQIENKLHTLVCDGQLSLATAQHDIASNWWTAYTRYVGASAPAPATTSHHVTQPPAPVANPGGGATALCNDGTYSYAAHHQGACSHHGGVSVFYT